MKILILGNTNNIWAVSYISNVLNRPDDDIWISSGDYISPDYQMFYEKCNIHILDTSKKITICGKELKGCEFFRLIKTIRAIFKNKNFDVIHMHYVSRTYLIAYKITKNHYDRSVATFWGSDLLRHGNRYFMLFGGIVKSFDCITVATYNMKNELMKKIPQLDERKIHLVQFGIQTIESIHLLSQSLTKEECRARMGLPLNKYIIAIGYNRSKAQHHKDVILALRDIRIPDKRQICVVLQLTYGPKDDVYIADLISLLDQNNINHVEYYDYMSQEQSSILRLSVDCFINSQETDALSATMIEYLFAGATIINSSNLKYKELSDYHERIYEFDDYRDICNCLQRCIGLDHQVLEEYKKRLRDQFSWESLSPIWRSIYNNRVYDK